MLSQLSENGSVYLLYGVKKKEDFFTAPTLAVSIIKQKKASGFVPQHLSPIQENAFFEMFLKKFVFETFAWSRGVKREDKTVGTYDDLGLNYEGKLLLGYYHDEQESIIYQIALRYPNDMSAIRALDIVEMNDYGKIPPVIFAVLLAEDYALRLRVAGNIPSFFVQFPHESICVILRTIPAVVIPSLAPSPRKTDKEIKKLIDSIPQDVFQGKWILDEKDFILFKGQKVIAYNVFLKAMFADFDSLRGIDIANLIWQFSHFLWSKEWWASPNLFDFSNRYDTEYGNIVVQAALCSTFTRSPIFDIFGTEIVVGDNLLRSNNILTFKPKNQDAVDLICHSMHFLWFQLCEFYSMGITTKAVRDLYPDGVFKFTALGIDYRFEVDDKIAQLKTTKKYLVERAESHAAFIPTGCFRLNLPEELIKTITKLQLHSDTIENPIVEHIDLSSLLLSVDEKGMWVKMIGKSGAGPSVRWSLKEPLKTNVISVSFGEILDVILAALWHDMRVEGERSVRNIEKHQPKLDGIKNIPPAPKVKEPKEEVIVLPRKIYEVRFTGKREWASEEERIFISRIAHAVSGHRRVLPEGWKASDKQRELAEEAGIFLPPGVTYVSPYATGTDNKNEVLDEDGKPIKNPARIISKGLAMIITFLTKGEKKKSKEAKA